MRGNLAESARQDSNLIISVVVQLHIIVSFIDLLGRLGQLSQRFRNPVGEVHGQNEEDNQQENEENNNLFHPVSPKRIDL